MATVVLKQGHVQPVWAGHPWVYAQAVERVEGGAIAGGEVDVVDPRGNWLGRGLYSPGSALTVRIYTHRPGEQITPAFFAQRIEQARQRRALLGLPAPGTDAYRLIHAEGDELPGLIVDCYRDVLVVQLGTLGLKRREDVILDALERALAPRAIVDRTSNKAASLEGFEARSGVVRGDPELGELAFQERGLSYEIPLELGQKTGFYLDQRGLRERVESLARGRSVLDVFCYVGALSLGAARGGASHVTAVDSSGLALAVAAKNAAKNGLGDRVEFQREDGFEALNHAGRHGGADLVICDPPKVAPTRANKKRALTLMRRLAGAGCRATKPGGLFVLCSCSAAVGHDELARAAALGGRDVGTKPLVLERWFQGADHPVLAALPEGLYLSALILQVLPR